MASKTHPALVATLQSLPRAQARKIAAQIAQLQNSGLRTIRVFPKGIPTPDTVELSALIDRQSLLAILSKIVAQAPKRGVVVFPYGIPAVDAFEVKLDLQ